MRLTQRFWILLIVVIALWFALKDIAYQRFMAGDNMPDNPPASYQTEEGWAIQPVESPPGAWLEPWGIDLFIIPPPSGAIAGPGIVDAYHVGTRADMARTSHQIAYALAPAGPGYSVLYRHPSPARLSEHRDWDVAREDIATAFEQYLYSKNNWRGIMLVAGPDTLPLARPLLDRINTSPRLQERFAGLVILQEGSIAPNINVACSAAMQGNCLIVAEIENLSGWFDWIAPSLARKPMRFEFQDVSSLAASLAERNKNLSLWLDANAPKPAEPLGGLEDVEVIEIAPVRRPGETDEFLRAQEMRNTED